ncbi:hypothetical protein EI94DRAFT_811621 [Lactarius quietus]|nr:hypothetical protein EI94DRAFT_1290312 [Lactarius quietus]KAF8261367.1 hypothetical protein EI94DRAFT_811621 [Lactarius quietus]
MCCGEVARVSSSGLHNPPLICPPTSLTGSPSHPQQSFKIFLPTMQFKTVPRPPAPPTASLPSASTYTEPSTILYHAATFRKHAQGTLSALCVRRRMQTLYHEHTSENNGMILAVELENVPANAVRTQKRSARLRAYLSWLSWLTYTGLEHTFNPISISIFHSICAPSTHLLCSPAIGAAEYGPHDRIGIRILRSRGLILACVARGQDTTLIASGTLNSAPTTHR